MFFCMKRATIFLSCLFISRPDSSFCEKRNDIKSPEAQSSKDVPVAQQEKVSTTISNNESISHNINAFASEMNKVIFPVNIKDKSETLVWSPISVYATLVPLYLGAEDTTLEELKNVMNIEKEGESFDNFAQSCSRSPLLKSVTGLFVNEDVTLDPDYKEKLTNSVFKNSSGTTAKIKTLNFHQNLVKSTNYINSFIKDATSGMIDEIVDSTMISKDIKILIVNGVNFKGNWKTKFDSKMTRMEEFNGLKKSSQVEMMSQKGTYYFAEIPDISATALQLEYEDPSLRIMFVLPNEGTDLQTVFSSLNRKGKIDDIANKLIPTEMDLYVPKLRIDSKVPIQEALTKAGLSTLFIPQANLSRMLTKSKSGAEELYVSRIVHKCVFEMDEEGTKAAAATAGVLIPLSGFIVHSDIFRLDRPFIFILRDSTTGCIPFMGSVTDLESGEKDIPDRVNLISTGTKEQVKGDTKTRLETKMESTNSDVRGSSTDESKVKGVNKDDLSTKANNTIFSGINDTHAAESDLGSQTPATFTGEHESNNTDTVKDQETETQEATSNKNWWTHSGTPEYLISSQNLSTDLPSNNAFTMKTDTPRFQQPESKHPSAIKFPYPHKPNYHSIKAQNASIIIPYTLPQAGSVESSLESNKTKITMQRKK